MKLCLRCTIGIIMTHEGLTSLKKKNLSQIAIDATTKKNPLKVKLKKLKKMASVLPSTSGIDIDKVLGLNADSSESPEKIIKEFSAFMESMLVMEPIDLNNPPKDFPKEILDLLKEILVVS